VRVRRHILGIFVSLGARARVFVLFNTTVCDAYSPLSLILIIFIHRPDARHAGVLSPAAMRSLARLLRVMLGQVLTASARRIGEPL